MCGLHHDCIRSVEYIRPVNSYRIHMWPVLARPAASVWSRTSTYGSYTSRVSACGDIRMARMVMYGSRIRIGHIRYVWLPCGVSINSVRPPSGDFKKFLSSASRRGRLRSAPCVSLAYQQVVVAERERRRVVRHRKLTRSRVQIQPTLTTIFFL